MANNTNSTCLVYVAASVDGFIARADGDVEWLQRPEYSVEAMKGLSYEQFITDIDAVVMGRNTFEKVLGFGEWAYDIPVVVLTSRSLDIPDRLKGKVSIDAGTPEAIIKRLTQKKLTRLYIDGGLTIQAFLLADCIDELIITRIPVLLGSGLPLFSMAGAERPLKLLNAVASKNGFVQERYLVI
jgi:dihydrofolate reductase